MVFRNSYTITFTFTIDFQSPLIPVLSIFMGQAKTLHINNFDKMGSCLKLLFGTLMLLVEQQQDYKASL